MFKENLKIYMINSVSLGVTTFSNIESGLKILLLLVTIGFTISKWIGIKNQIDKEKK
jgi:hypothetical protein